MECCACGHFSQFPDEHGCIAGWWQLEGELQSKQTAPFAFCSQTKTQKMIPGLNFVHDRSTTQSRAVSTRNVKTENT